MITISSYRITVSVMANEQPVSHFTLTSFLTFLESFLELWNLTLTLGNMTINFRHHDFGLDDFWATWRKPLYKMFPDPTTHYNDVLMLIAGCVYGLWEKKLCQCKQFYVRIELSRGHTKATQKSVFSEPCVDTIKNKTCHSISLKSRAIFLWTLNNLLTRCNDSPGLLLPTVELVFNKNLVCFIQMPF